jgi:AcrR family transcriptional regulator
MHISTEISKTDKTRNDIIRAAEMLFAQKGFRAMTLRDVTHKAQVNLAAVNYHFGSKKELVLAVIRNRFEPINCERIRRLDELTAAHAPSPIPVDAIFAALICPLFESASSKNDSEQTLIQMIARAITEPANFLRTLHDEFFTELSIRFMTELRRSRPQLPEEVHQYRFFLAISTMIGTIIEQTSLEHFTDGTLDPTNLDKIATHLIAFCVAGYTQAE